MVGKKKTKAPRKRKREKPGLLGRARRYVVAAIHITRNPVTRNMKVFKMKPVSGDTPG